MNSTSDSEREFLERVASTYTTNNSPQDDVIRGLALRTFKQYMAPKGKALEFGCDDGAMTQLISNEVERLTVVDGAMSFIERAKSRNLENVVFIHSLFEEFRTDEKYDYIFASYVLEHVVDVQVFLKRAYEALADSGYLFIVVPNARAMSRQLARHMGLINDLYALTENDLNHGHRRVYDRVLLDQDLNMAGFQQVGQGGLMLKMLADFQMNKLFELEILSERQVEGLYKMGLEYPDFAGSLYSVCKKK